MSRYGPPDSARRSERSEGHLRRTAGASKLTEASASSTGPALSREPGDMESLAIATSSAFSISCRTYLLPPACREARRPAGHRFGSLRGTVPNHDARRTPTEKQRPAPKHRHERQNRSAKCSRPPASRHACHFRFTFGRSTRTSRNLLGRIGWTNQSSARPAKLFALPGQRNDGAWKHKLALLLGCYHGRSEEHTSEL